MTLADHILDKLNEIKRHDESFGALVGLEFFAPDYARNYAGKELRISDGVKINVPDEPRWYTSDIPGGVRLEFTGELPTVAARKGIVNVASDLEAVSIRLDHMAVYATLHLKKFGIQADIDVTVKLI